MDITVNIPAPLRQYCNKTKQITLEGSTVAEILEEINKQYNLLYSKICDEDKNVRQYVNIYINGVDIKKQDKLSTSLKEGDVINIIPAVAGGKSSSYRKEIQFKI